MPGSEFGFLYAVYVSRVSCDEFGEHVFSSIFDNRIDINRDDFKFHFVARPKHSEL